MDTFLIGFALGFTTGIVLSLWWGWGQRKGRIAAERLLRVPIGQIVQRERR